MKNVSVGRALLPVFPSVTNSSHPGDFRDGTLDFIGRSPCFLLLRDFARIRSERLQRPHTA